MSADRQTSGSNALVLFRAVAEAQDHFIYTHNKPPQEVWLGPKEARILEVEINWQDAEGLIVHTNKNQSAMIRGSMEGAQLMGLHVRLMVADGVQVGISWPSPAA